MDVVKKRINKIVGYISKEIAERYNLYKYEDQEIIESLDLYSHVHKQIKKFDSIDSYNNTS